MKEKFFIIGLLLISILWFPACSAPRQFDQDSSKSSFRYREIYLPDAIGVYADSLGLNSLDKDWAIWGHNLSRMLPEKPSESIYAKVNGVTVKKQFCFTSPRLFEYITEYIDEEYSSKDKSRFAIMPNDNDIVCLCVRCTEIGNTNGNASPAVFSLIRKLSDRFPNHVFYTSDYGTTRELPVDSLPANAGVLVSAMPYPLSFTSHPGETSFLKTIDDWGTKTNRILVWDYINNFDDYFTPFPVLGVMQNRLKNYKNHKVTGIFLNGSGPDPSAFSRINSVVLAALTANPDIDWTLLLRNKAKEFYPVTGDLIADFMITQENHIKDNNAILPLYEGVDIARRRYLPVEAFISFHDSLKNLKDITTGRERKETEILLGELALTRLEINRINGDVTESEPFISDLELLLNSDIPSYNEAGWSIEGYLKDYRFMLDHFKESRTGNKLKGIKLTPLSSLDEDYSDISIITDGLLGLPSNYHNGHMITSPEKETSISIPFREGAERLVVWMPYNTGYKIHLPESVTLEGEGMAKITKNPEYPKDLSGHSKLIFDLPKTLSGPLTLTLTKNPETRSMAIEEIEIY